MTAARLGLADWERLGVNERIKLLKLGAAAAMIALQLARPLRTANVHQLTVGDGAELRRPRRAGAPAQVVIDRRRVKNCNDIEHALPWPLWEIVSFWLDELRPRWIAMHAQRGARETISLSPE